MSKVFIDTNIFLDFYSSDKKEQLQTVSTLIHDNLGLIVFPTQVYYEFLRNRERILNNIIKNLPVLNHINIPILKGTEELNSINKTGAEFREKKDELEQILSHYINAKQHDLIFKMVNEIRYSFDVYHIDTDDEELFTKAQKRFLIGNPPGTSNSTLCDELIWEAILTLDEDLYFVSRDKASYGTYKAYLTEEYEKATGKTLMFMDKISSAFKQCNTDLSNDAIEAEQTVIDSIKESILVTENATIQKFNDPEEYLEHLRKVHSHKPVYFCPHCQRDAPFNGAICLLCGYKSEDNY